MAFFRYIWFTRLISLKGFVQSQFIGHFLCSMTMNWHVHVSVYLIFAPIKTMALGRLKFMIAFAYCLVVCLLSLDSISYFCEMFICQMFGMLIRPNVDSNIYMFIYLCVWEKEKSTYNINWIDLKYKVGVLKVGSS